MFQPRDLRRVNEMGVVMVKRPIVKEITDIPLQPTALGGNARILADNPHLRVVNLFISAGEQVRVHTAPVEAIFLVLEGNGTVEIGEKDYLVSAGQFTICPADCGRAIKANRDEDLNLLVIRAPNL